MTLNKRIQAFQKCPPDKPGRSGSGFGMRSRLKKLALLVLVQQLLVRTVSACTVATFTAPSSPSTYTYVIGSGPYTFDIAAWT